MRTPLPQETLDHIISYIIEDLEYEYINYFLIGYELVRFIKVCKAWRFAGNRHLYETLTICSEYEDKSVRNYLPNLCRSLEENPSLRGLVKNVVIDDVYDEGWNRQVHFKELLTLCSSARNIVLGDFTPPDAGSYHKILAGRKLRELTLKMGRCEDGFFFSSDTDLIRFITTLPDIENVWCGGKNNIFPVINIPGWDDRDENREQRQRRPRLKEFVPVYQPPLTLEVKTYTTLPLTCLNIFMSGAVSECGLKLLTTLTLPYLREVRICFLAGEETDKLMLECLAKWPKEMKVLELRRHGPGNSTQKTEFVKALDQFPILKELSFSTSMVSLDYIFSRPTVKRSVIHGILDNNELELLSSKLEKMEDGPVENVPVYLPLLKELTIYWRSPEGKYNCPEVYRLIKICMTRREERRFKISINIFCDTQKTWSNYSF